jgi:hypothetical protein
VRYMMLMIPGGYADAPPDAKPDAEAMETMMRYNKALGEAGVLVALDGLYPPSAGARVTFNTGKPVVADGPFAETKDVLGGYWMLKVGSREEAIAWARRCPAGENDTLELRQVFEMAEAPEQIQQLAVELGID